MAKHVCFGIKSVREYGSNICVELDALVGEVAGRRGGTWRIDIWPVGWDRDDHNPKGRLAKNCAVMASNPEHGTWGEIRRAQEAGTYLSVAAGDVIVTEIGRWEVCEAPRYHDDIPLRRIDI